MIQPASKLADIVETLIRLSAVESPNALEVNRIRREAQALITTGSDAQSGYAIIGMVDALVFKTDESIASFKNALKLGYDSTHVANFAVALERLGKISMAWELLSKEYPKHPMDIELHRHAHRVAILTFNVEAKLEIEGILKKLMIDTKPLEDQAELKAFSERLSRHGKSLADARAVMECAVSYLVSKKIAVRAESFKNFGDGQLAVYLHVGKTPEQAAELSFGLAETLVSDFPDPMDEHLTISCLPMREKTADERIGG